MLRRSSCGEPALNIIGSSLGAWVLFSLTAGLAIECERGRRWSSVRRAEAAVNKCYPSSPRGYLVDMEEETRRELASLQREKEVLQAKEKDNLDAIDEV